ncbi:hypothetical protein ACFBZI_11115 [Moraxella sp. ZJ142]|uniref:hypothetical protein n=1 Tax=Moraxella marmotae TaxID=3344520 RepID=UPI0035D3EDB8
MSFNSNLIPDKKQAFVGTEQLSKHHLKLMEICQAMDFNALARLDTDVLIAAATNVEFVGKINMKDAYEYQIELLFENLVRENYGEIAYLLLNTELNGFFNPLADAWFCEHSSLNLNFHDVNSFYNAVTAFEEFNKIVDFANEISLRNWGDSRTGRCAVTHEGIHLFTIYHDLLTQLDALIVAKRHKEIVDACDGELPAGELLDLNYGKLVKQEYLDKLVAALLQKARGYCQVELLGRKNIIPFSHISKRLDTKSVVITDDTPTDESHAA